MSTDASGNYTLPSADIENGQVGDAAPVQTNFDDIEAALTERITKTGKTTYTANQPMGGFKMTGLGAGSTAGDSVRYEQLIEQIGQTVSVQTGAVDTGTTTMPFDDTIPQNTEGDEYMTLAITPKSASSILVIDVRAVVATSANPQQMTMALFQDSTAGALAATSDILNGSASGQTRVLTLRHAMTSGGTTEITFKVRIGGNTAGTTTFNGSAGARLMGGVMSSGILIREHLA